MSQGRKGHTLLELIAVIAILVGVAAISFPLIKPMMQSREQDAAADVIRARWSQLRTKAITHGRAYTFECKQATGKFRCVPEAEEEADDEDAHPSELELPGEIKFAEARTGNDASSSDGGWTRVATFLPDGTARHDAQITIGHGSNAVTLRLHSATGLVSSGSGEGEVKK